MLWNFSSESSEKVRQLALPTIPYQLQQRQRRWNVLELGGGTDDGALGDVWEHAPPEKFLK